MKSFAALLYEAINIQKFEYFSGPLSSGVRNVNVARAELDDNIDKSRANDDTGDYRALYDTQSKKFWVWYAIDGMHSSIVKHLGKDDWQMVHLTYNVKNKFVFAGTSNANKLTMDDQPLFWKFFGKRINYINSANKPIFKGVMRG